MKYLTGLVLACFGLGACAVQPVPEPSAPPAPKSAKAALDLYYQTYADADFPVAPAGAPMPASDQVLRRILLASCNNEESESPALAQIAKEEADLFLMVGDNVYGDMQGRAYINNDPDLKELKESYAELAGRAEFQAVRAAHPMMVSWDDHDYGVNDGGRDFAFKTLAERMHETFWGLNDQAPGAREGTYYADTFGPEGQRVQLIMLDTRTFRSDLIPTDEWGKKGKERYLPAPDTAEQDLLGSAQWDWLAAQLAKPADIRLIASSIQVLPTVHGWESWNKLPLERSRLFEVIEASEAAGVVFLSGDRHTAFIYKDETVLPYEAHELTASSLNLSFASETSEQDKRQIGAGYPPENFGAVEIDWEARTLSLNVLSNTGETVRENTLAFSAIGLN